MSHRRIDGPVVDFMRSITHREFRTWIAWLEIDWNRPNPDQAYLMQIACEVARVLAKNPRSIRLEHFKSPMSFSFRRQRTRQLTREESAKRKKALWIGAFGGRVERRVKYR